MFRALAGWGVVSFAILQVIEPVLHAYHLPEWPLTLVVTTLGAGFPVVAILAWMFDLTPRGIERTTVAPGPEGARTGLPRGRFAVLLVAVGIAAAVPGLVYFFVWPGSGRLPPAPSVAGPGSSEPKGPPSVAVLPFADLSPQRDQEYLADGVAEEILGALAHVDGLRVPGRTSSFWFKGKGAKLAEIGRELQVGAVLEGSVRKDGNRIRITAQLLDARNGYQLWSETFDRELTDVFRIQDEISRAVATALQVKLLAGAPGKPRAGPSRIEAYEQVLLGRQLLAAGTAASILGAQGAFERALALDPAYAPAHAGLARAYGEVSGFLAETPEEVTRSALLGGAAAERAIALDPRLADGYVARAGHRLNFAWDWTGALADIERAVSIGTDDGWAYLERSEALDALGRNGEALTAARHATEVDHLSAAAWTNLVRVLWFAGDLAGAEAAARRALQISPDDPSPAFYLAAVLREKGRLDEALALLEKNGFEVFRLTGVAITQHVRGDAIASQAALDQLVARMSGTAAVQIAEVHAMRGDRDSAFLWLERARAQHDSGLAFLRTDVHFATLRSDPRWKALLARMNMPDG